MFGTRRALLALSALLAFPAAAAAAEFVVTPSVINETKAVFGQVESRDAVPARARIGGTVQSIKVDEGSEVTEGDVIATIVDEKIALQRQAADAKIQALASQLKNAQTDLDRSEQLLQKGSTTQSRVDQARTQVEVLTNQMAAAEAERAVIAAQSSEGVVLAPGFRPHPARPGDPGLGGTARRGDRTWSPAAATSFASPFPSAMRPRSSEGASVLVGDRPGASAPPTAMSKATGTGKLVKVYPQIQDGRVLADVEVDGLGDYFVGERTLVWIPVGKRSVVSVPARRRRHPAWRRLCPHRHRNGRHGGRRGPRRDLRRRRRAAGGSAHRPPTR